MNYDEDKERMKRIYVNYEINNKISKLVEYYKFHSEVPRLFMQPHIDIVNSHHNK